MIVDTRGDSIITRQQRKEPKNFNQVIQIKRHCTKEEADFIVQCARDVACMSELSYCNFRKALMPLVSLPMLCDLNIVKSRMNRMFPISNNMFGSYVNSIKKLVFALNRAYLKLDKQIKDDTFCIEYCGDGTMLTKTHMNVLNFASNIMNLNDHSFRSLDILGT